jgi:hypothetical protein
MRSFLSFEVMIGSRRCFMFRTTVPVVTAHPDEWRFRSARAGHFD